MTFTCTRLKKKQNLKDIGPLGIWYLRIARTALKPVINTFYFITSIDCDKHILTSLSHRYFETSTLCLRYVWEGIPSTLHLTLWLGKLLEEAEKGRLRCQNTTGLLKKCGSAGLLARTWQRITAATPNLGKMLLLEVTEKDFVYTEIALLWTPPYFLGITSPGGTLALHFPN